MLIESLSASGLGLTIQSTAEQIFAALKEKFPEKIIIYANGTIVEGYNIYSSPSSANGSAGVWWVYAQDASGTNTSIVYARTAKQIDVTGYKKIVFSYYLRSDPFNQGMTSNTVLINFGLSQNGTSLTNFNKNLRTKSTSPVKEELDISDAEGYFFVMLYGVSSLGAYGINLYSVELTV